MLGTLVGYDVILLIRRAKAWGAQSLLHTRITRSLLCKQTTGVPFQSDQNGLRQTFHRQIRGIGELKF